MKTYCFYNNKVFALHLELLKIKKKETIDFMKCLIRRLSQGEKGWGNVEAVSNVVS